MKRRSPHSTWSWSSCSAVDPLRSAATVRSATRKKLNERIKFDYINHTGETLRIWLTSFTQIPADAQRRHFVVGQKERRILVGVRRHFASQDQHALLLGHLLFGQSLHFVFELALFAFQRLEMWSTLGGERVSVSGHRKINKIKNYVPTYFC